MSKHIGRYEILAELGRGGFGQVYRGLDPTVGRQVAIKTLVSDGDPGLLTRFRNEASASGRLRHNNIVTIYDSGEQDGRPYIVMELLEGQDLQRAIAEQISLSLLKKFDVMTQIGAGLRHAHAHGIIHRDVKPANVMLLHDGSVKIMDFGIALVTKSTASRLTPQGAMIGTFRYMAPEQFRGADPDSRSDIFSYGLIFYELLAGIHPFHAVDAAAQMYKILSEEPVPIGDLVPDAPKKAQILIGRLLQKDPDLRYQNLDDVLFDLEPAVQGLRAARAQELLAEARATRAEGHPEKAQELVRQVLDLTPAHEEAREFHEEVRIEIRRHAIRPRVEELLQKGKAAMAAGEPGEAIHFFESAMRFDNLAAEPPVLLQEARVAVEQQREVARLVAEAEHVLRDGDCSAAERLAREALALAPSNSEALRVQERAAAALAEEKRQLRLATDLPRARSLIEIHSWDEAADLLSAMDRDLPGVPEIAALSNEVNAGRLKEERERNLASGLSAARQHVHRGDLQAACHQLEDLAQTFSDSHDVTGMLRFVRSEIEQKRRHETVKAALDQARAFSGRHEPNEAQNVLERALAEYPADPDLQRELRSVLAAKKEAERRSAAERAIAEAEKLRHQGQLIEAIECLRLFLVAHGDHTAIEELREVIVGEQEAARRALEVREFLHQARELIDRDQPEAATAFLKSPPRHVGHNSEITRLLDVAETQARVRAERQSSLETSLTLAADLRGRGRFDEALPVLTAFQEKYGPEPRIEEATRGLELDRQEFELAVADLAQRATALLPANPNAATTLLMAVPDYFREHAAIQAVAELAAQAEQDRQAVVDITAKAAGLSAKEDFAAALDVLNEGLARFPGRLEIKDAHAKASEALEQQQRAELHGATAARVDELVKARNYEEAAAVVSVAVAGAPGDEWLQDLHANVQKRRNDWIAEQADLEVQATLDRARQMPDPADAIALLEDLARKYSSRTEIATARAEAEGRSRALREQQEKEKAAQAAAERQQAVASINELRSEGKFTKARTRHKEAVKRLGAAAEFEEALALIEKDEQAEAERRHRQAVAELTAKAGKLSDHGEFAAALRILDEGLTQFPAEPEIEATRVKTLVALETQRREGRRRATAAKADEFLKLHRYDEAAAAVARALETDPGDDVLQQLRAKVEASRSQWIAEQADLEIRETLARAGQAFQQNPAEAVALLEPLSKQYPNRAEVSAALTEAKKRVKALQEEAEKQQAAAALQSARELRDRDPAAALKLLEGLAPNLRHRPDVEREVQACLQAKAAAEQAEKERRTRQAVEELLAKAQKLSGAGDYAAALRVLDEGLTKVPGRPDLLSARAEAAKALETQRREELRRTTAAKVKELVEINRYEEAALTIAGALAGNPSDDVLHQLRKDVDASRDRWIAEQTELDIRQMLARADQVLDSDPAAAVTLLEGLSRKYAGRVEIAGALTKARKRLNELREKEEKQKASAAVESAREMRGRDPQGALRLLEGLAQPIRSRPEIEQEIQASRQVIAEIARRAAVAASVADVDKLCAKGKFAKARTRHTEALAKLGSAAELDEALARIEEAERSKKKPVGIETASRGRKPIWVAAGVVAAAVVGIAIWALSHSKQEAPVIVAKTESVSTPPAEAVTPPKENPSQPPANPVVKEQKAAAVPSGRGTASSNPPKDTPVQPRTGPKQFVPTAPPSTQPAGTGAGKTEPPPPAPSPAPTPVTVNQPPIVATAPVIVAAPPPTKAEPATKQPATPPDEGPAILKVVQGFAAAFSRKDIAAVAEFYPKAVSPDLRDNFKKPDSDYRVNYSLEVAGSPQVQGDRAQVSAQRTIISTIRGAGKPKVGPATVTVSLQKAGTGWVITDIR